MRKRILQLDLYTNTIINSYKTIKEAANKMKYNYNSFARFMNSCKPKYGEYRWAYEGEWRDHLIYISYTDPKGKKQCFCSYKEASDKLHIYYRYIKKYCDNRENGFSYEIVQYTGK